MAAPVRQRLAKAGRLTPEGRLSLPVDTGGKTGADPSADVDLIRDMCTFLFGSPTDVAKRTLLPVSPESSRTSELLLSPNGTFLVCTYNIAGRVRVALSVGHPGDDWHNGIITRVQLDGLLGIISYAPDFATPTISGVEAIAWLQFVLPRVDDGAPRS